jgi:2-phospho-L-lactate guanylyltransferase
VSATRTWSFVVPVKGGPTAKSRLRSSDPAPVGAAELAEAFAQDTVAALRTGMPDAPVLVVTADAGVSRWATAAGCAVIGDAGHGLNAAIRAGLAAAAVRTRCRAVILGDHPALTAAEVRGAVSAAAAYATSFVPDADGTGTAALFTTGPELTPRFGPGSAAQHAATGARRLEVALPGLRQDVDDASSLEAARRLGVGAHTRAALAG